MNKPRYHQRGNKKPSDFAKSLAAFLLTIVVFSSIGIMLAYRG